VIDDFILHELGATAWSVAMAVLPLAALFLAFQVLWLKLPRTHIRNILAGTLLAAAGLFLFLLGVGIGFMPFGQIMGEALGTLSPKWLMVPVGVALGLVTAWGEPAVRILADQVEDASSGSIPKSLVLYAICIGVAMWVGLGMLRIAYGVPLLYFLVPGYGLVMALMWLTDRSFVAIAVDAGGVATGPVANTLLLALALGASASMGGQNPAVDGLGLVSLIALAPMISVMTLGILLRGKKRQKEQEPC
jgi:hypothetical protein